MKPSRCLSICFTYPCPCETGATDTIDIKNRRNRLDQLSIPSIISLDCSIRASFMNLRLAGLLGAMQLSRIGGHLVAFLGVGTQSFPRRNVGYLPHDLHAPSSPGAMPAAPQSISISISNTSRMISTVLVFVLVAVGSKKFQRIDPLFTYSGRISLCGRCDPSKKQVVVTAKESSIKHNESHSVAEELFQAQSTGLVDIYLAQFGTLCPSFTCPCAA